LQIALQIQSIVYQFPASLFGACSPICHSPPASLEHVLPLSFPQVTPLSFPAGHPTVIPTDHHSVIPTCFKRESIKPNLKKQIRIPCLINELYPEEGMSCLKVLEKEWGVKYVFLRGRRAAVRGCTMPGTGKKPKK